MDKREALIQRQSGLKKPENRRGLVDILKTATKVGGAALAILGAKEAQAGSPPPVPPGVVFPEEVNGLGGPDYWNGIDYAQLNKKASLNQFSMIFTAGDGNGGNSPYPYGAYTFDYEVVGDGKGGLILKQIGEPKKDLVIHKGFGRSYIEFSRSDGKTDTLTSDGLLLNGVTHFDSAYCSPGDIDTSPSPSVTKSREVKLPDSKNIYPFASWDNNVWRLNIDEADYCLALQNALEAAQAAGFADAWEAGLLVKKESKAGEDELTAPETEEMIAVSRDGFIYLYTRDPADPMNLTSLKRDKSKADAPLTLNPAGTIDYNDIPDAKAHAMLRVNTKPDGSGEDANLLVFYHGDDLRVAGYKKQSDGTYNHVPISFDKDLTAIVDSDGDGTEDSVEATSGKCQWRADPSPTDDPAGMVDELGPEGIPDEISDACAADCEEAGWPGKNAPAGKGETDFWECDKSELGYAHAFTRGDGSSLHSNMDLETGTDEEAGQHVNLKPGQEAYWYHSKTPWGAGAPSPDFKLPPGNSVSVKILSAKKPDGSPAKVTLKYTPFEDGILGEPVEVMFDNPTEWTDFPVQVGGILGSDGTAMIVKVGEENVVVPCPPVCGPEVGPEPEPELTQGVDVGADAGVDAGPEPAAAVEPAPEPGPEPSEDAEAEDCAEEGAVVAAELTVVAEPVVPETDAADMLDAGSAGPDIFTESDIPVPPDTELIQPDAPPIVSPVDSGVDADSGSAEPANDTTTQDTAPSLDTPPSSDTPPQQDDTAQDTAPSPDTTPAGEETGADALHTDTLHADTSSEAGTQPGTEAVTNTEAEEEDNTEGNENGGGGGGNGGCDLGGGSGEQAPTGPESSIPFIVAMAVAAALTRIRKAIVIKDRLK